jgi:hypothetical protein
VIALLVAGVVAHATLADATYYSQQEADALFKQATEQASKEQYVEAMQTLQKLEERGFGGPDVLYNLGTVALSAGELGEAVLALERAHRAAPNDDDIEANLSLARSKQLDQVVGQGGPFLQRFVDSTRASWFAVVFALTWGATFLLLIGRRYVKDRKVWTALAVLSGVATLPTGAALAAHIRVRETHHEAVVMAKTLPTRDLPSHSAKVTFELHEGLKVRVLEEAEGFLRIRLPNGLEGWAPKDGVAAI